MNMTDEMKKDLLNGDFDRAYKTAVMNGSKITFYEFFKYGKSVLPGLKAEEKGVRMIKGASGKWNPDNKVIVEIDTINSHSPLETPLHGLRGQVIAIEKTVWGEYAVYVDLSEYVGKVKTILLSDDHTENILFFYVGGSEGRSNKAYVIEGDIWALYKEMHHPADPEDGEPGFLRTIG